MFGVPFHEIHARFTANVKDILTDFSDVVKRVLVVWECWWYRRLSHHQSPEKLYLSGELYPKKRPPRLPLRTVVAGGKSESFYHFYEVNETLESAYFDDANALYASESMHNEFPVGKSITLATPLDIQNYLVQKDKQFFYKRRKESRGRKSEKLEDGWAEKKESWELVKAHGALMVRIAVPFGLNLHQVPYLLLKHQSKAIGCLCYQCLTEDRNGLCNHRSLETRAFDGWYVIPDLERALELGYKV